jgi:hypothetical protein
MVAPTEVEALALLERAATAISDGAAGPADPGPP